jgi:uncharacterized cupin superfamily protein
MERVSIDAVEASAFEADVEVRPLSEPLGATDVSVNRYRVPPGRRLSGGLHAHEDQEELFVVIEGEATFETLDGERVVGAGEAVRFGRGEFQSGRNAGEADLVLFALGAPMGTEDFRVPKACGSCGHDDLRPEYYPPTETATLVCPSCGAESEVACSACGSDDKLVVLGEDGETPIDRCRDCGAESVAR